MRFTSIIIGLLAFFCLSFNLQAKPSTTAVLNSSFQQQQQAKPVLLARSRHHRRNRRLFWITAGAITAATIANSARRGRVVDCRVWYRGRYRYGYKRPGEPCFVNYRGRTMGFHRFEILN